MAGAEDVRGLAGVAVLESAEEDEESAAKGGGVGHQRVDCVYTISEENRRVLQGSKFKASMSPGRITMFCAGAVIGDVLQARRSRRSRAGCRRPSPCPGRAAEHRAASVVVASELVAAVVRAAAHRMIPTVDADQVPHS